MDLVRRKLDFDLLKFRFKFVENGTPILNIKIDRYRILCDSKEMTSIYLEKGEVNNFMKNMELTEQEYEKIYWKNAAKLYNIPASDLEDQ
jgi:hypothetical protein